MFQITLVLFLFQFQDTQAPYPPVNRSDSIEQAARFFWADEQESSAFADAARREAAYEQREFARRFNGLMKALLDFAASYDSAQVINAKKAKLVRKALRDLEKSDWFRSGKED
jgi:hypothetical protein